MNRLLFYFLFLLSSQAQARSYLNLDELSLKLTRFGCNRELQTPDIECTDYIGRVGVQFDLSLIDNWMYWKNQVQSEGVSAKFMTVGWHWEFGFSLSPVIDVFWEHHSRHVMDRAQPYYWDERTESPQRVKYPVEDSYGIRIRFYERKR